MNGESADKCRGRSGGHLLKNETHQTTNLSHTINPMPMKRQLLTEIPLREAKLPSAFKLLDADPTENQAFL
jgi:hypothetical protein